MPSNPVKVTSLSEEMDRNGEARIAAVIAEFGGDVDAKCSRHAVICRTPIGALPRPQRSPVEEGA